MKVVNINQLLCTVVLNYYFAFSCRPLGTLLRFPYGGTVVGLQCKSESAQMFRKIAEPL